MRLLVVTGLLGLTGCSSLPTIAFDDLDDAMLQARCDRYVRCGVFTDAPTCSDFFRDRPDQALAAAVRAGTVRYDGELAKLCVDATAAMTCDTSSHEGRIPSQSCDRMFVGTLGPGLTCEFDNECTSNVCEPIAPCRPGMCCPGTCAELASKAAIDEACATSRDCTPDAFCGQDLVCHALGVESARCFVDAQCDFDFACDTRSFPGTCVQAAKLGDPCPDERCADIGARCSAAHTCIQRLPGDPCGDASDCSEFEECDATKKCVMIPKLGMSCTTSCAGEAWCDLSAPTGTCRAPLAKTEPCNADNECASLYCAEGPVFDSCDVVPVCF